MLGLHLTAELGGCDAAAAAMTDAAALRALCVDAVRDAGLRPLGELFHAFGGDGGNGVTGMVLLAESHLAVHTWPELGAVTLDVFVCNRSVDHSGAARRLLDRVAAAFTPARVQRHELQRDLPRRPA